MSVLALTTVDRAIAYIGDLSSSRWGDDQKSILSSIINAVSQEFEQYCSHGFKLEAWTEKRTIQTDFLWCYRWPVVSIASVSVSFSGRSADLSPLASSSYEVAPNGKGIMVFDVAPGSLVSYTYTGGLAADTAGIMSDHPNLEDCCLLQTVEEWKRHNNPGKTSIELGTGSTQWNAGLQLLDIVKQRLRQEYVAQADFL